MSEVWGFFPRSNKPPDTTLYHCTKGNVDVFGGAKLGTLTRNVGYVKHPGGMYESGQGGFPARVADLAVLPGPRVPTRRVGARARRMVLGGWQSPP